MTDEEEFALYRQPWVLFRVNGEVFALPISLIEQIVPVAEITGLPGQGGAVRGLMRFREGVVPLMDLRRVLVQGKAEPAGGDGDLRGAALVMR